MLSNRKTMTARYLITWRATILAFAVAGALGARPEAALADESCRATIADLVAGARTDDYVAVQMSVHGTAPVSSGYEPPIKYTKGWLDHRPTDSSWVLGGDGTQLLSNRISGTQPFDANRGEHLQFLVSGTGLLYVYNHATRTSTRWDMSCTNGFMTKVIPDVGVVTLTFILRSVID